MLQAAVKTISEPETSSESASTLSAQDVVWQPLPFGKRTRARIIVADDNNVSSFLMLEYNRAGMLRCMHRI